MLGQAAVSVMLDQCGRHNKHEVGRNIWDRLLSDGYKPSTNNFNSLIEMYARNSQFELAEQAIVEMEELGVPKDNMTARLVPGFKKRQPPASPSVSTSDLSPSSVSK